MPSDMLLLPRDQSPSGAEFLDRSFTSSMPERMRHAILGAGGVGGLIGACLAHSGAAVTMVVRREALEKHPAQLHLESSFGNYLVTVAVASEVPPADVLWISVKAMQLEPALTALKNPDAVRAIVPLLNGIDHISLLRAKYGSERVIPATIAVETERVSPGHIVHRSPFARLNVLSAGRPLLGSTLDQFQQMGFACRFIDDEPTLMWGKLVFLAPFALATTAANKTVGEILSDAQWRRLGEACVREACAVATAKGAAVDPEAILTGVKAMPATMRSSMQKDVDQHKPPELDAIAGPILRSALRHGIEVPATKKLVAAVEQRAGLAESLLAQ
jgi:2-dehydropantoate 2-reductase